MSNILHYMFAVTAVCIFVEVILQYIPFPGGKFMVIGFHR